MDNNLFCAFAQYLGKKMETPGDNLDLERIYNHEGGHEELEKMEVVWKGMNEIWENGGIEGYEGMVKPTPGKGYVNEGPHISVAIAEKLEPYKSFYEKYPAMYKTLAVWVWG